MKRTIVATCLLISGFAFSANSLPSVNLTLDNCTPITQDLFEELKETLGDARLDDKLKYKSAVKALKYGCFDTDKIDVVLSYFSDNDQYKLEYLYKAYEQCPDQDAFKEVVHEHLSDAGDTAIDQFIDQQ